MIETYKLLTDKYKKKNGTLHLVLCEHSRTRGNDIKLVKKQADIRPENIF